MCKVVCSGVAEHWCSIIVKQSVSDGVFVLLFAILVLFGGFFLFLFGLLRQGLTM